MTYTIKTDVNQLFIYKQRIWVDYSLTRILFIFLSIFLFQQVSMASQDSLNALILTRLDKIDKEQIDLSASLAKQQAFTDSLSTEENKTFWQRLEEDLKDPYQGFKTFMLFVFFTLSAFLLKKFGPQWWQNFVRWIVENEDARLKSNKKILVLSSKLVEKGKADNEYFVRNFFKNTGFNEANIQYRKIDSYQAVDFDYDLIFVNNEDGQFNKIQQSFLEEFAIQKPDTVLFYFSPTIRWDFIQTKISNRLNLANSKAQIYGNILSSLKYQDSKLSLLSRT